MTTLIVGVILLLIPFISLGWLYYAERIDRRVRIWTFVFVFPIMLFCSAYAFDSFRVHPALVSVTIESVVIPVILSLITAGVVVIRIRLFRRPIPLVHHPAVESFITLCYVCWITGFFMVVLLLAMIPGPLIFYIVNGFLKYVLAPFAVIALLHFSIKTLISVGKTTLKLYRYASSYYGGK